MFKKILVIINFCLCFFILGNEANAQTFSDVLENHPYYNAIEDLTNKGILNGYPDKTFRPDNAINRVEILKILLLGSGVEIEETSYNAGFPDVISNSWYAKYIVKAKEQNIIQGNPDGYFYPNAQVNFAEALKMLAIANNVQLNTNLNTDPFLDVPKDSWYAPYFEYAKSINIIKKDSNESVTPAKPLDRGETAQLIFLFQETETVTTEEQIATYYADIFQNRSTASGEIFDQNKLTAAHKTLAFGTQVKVTNLENDESVIVTINDRGPYASNPSYVLDLSKSAFQSISPLSRGIIKIKYEVIASDETVQTLENDNLNTTEKIATIEINDTQTDESIVLSENNQETEVIQTENVVNLETCQKEYEKKVITKDFYEDVVLIEEIPTLFQKNEIYSIRGNLNDKNYTVATVFLINALDENDEYRFEVTIDNNGDFTIPIIFNKIGTFNLGILKGESGKSYIAEIQVISNQCLGNFQTASLAPTNLQIEYKDENSLITWENHGQNLSKVEIRQSNNTNIYIVNNSQESFNIPYQDFANFSQGEVFFSISGANSDSNFSIDQSSQWEKSDEKTFNAVKHHKTFNNLTEVSFNNLVNTYSLGNEISVSGESTHDLSMNASIILPTGLVGETALFSENFGTNTLGKKIIEANKSFQFKYTPATKGTYILEINKDNGFAVINMPIYEKGTMPLIPDIWDTNQHLLVDNSDNFNLENSRNELLEKLNKSRQEFGAKTVVIDNNLNQLAQDRAEDMAQNNYLEHRNLQGKYANDLKTNYNIKSNVAENIAKDTTIEFTHEGLMRSAVHRENILNQTWTRTGLGIATNSEGYLIIVEEFSEDELSKNDLPQMRSEVLETVNLKRSDHLLSDANLDEIAQNWSENILNRAEVWFEDPDTGISLSYLISSQTDSDKQSASTILKGAFEPILEQIDTNDTVINEKWKKLGTGITQNNDGSLNVTMVYSE